MLEPGEQLADPDRPHLAGVELQGAALGPERGLGLDDDPRALGQRHGHGVQSRRADGDVERHVDVGVAQGEIGGGLTRAAADLDHLALDPQG